MTVAERGLAGGSRGGAGRRIAVWTAKAWCSPTACCATSFRLEPNAATVGFDNLVSGQALLRGVKPEAVITVDGKTVEVGGLTGQPNYAFLREEWLDTLSAAPAAMRFTGFAIGPIEERMAWKQVRHHAPGIAWPPKASACASSTPCRKKPRPRP